MMSAHPASGGDELNLGFFLDYIVSEAFQTLHDGNLTPLIFTHSYQFQWP